MAFLASQPCAAFPQLFLLTQGHSGAGLFRAFALSIRPGPSPGELPVVIGLPVLIPCPLTSPSVSVCPLGLGTAGTNCTQVCVSSWCDPWLIPAQQAGGSPQGTWVMLLLNKCSTATLCLPLARFSLCFRPLYASMCGCQGAEEGGLTLSLMWGCCKLRTVTGAGTGI